MLTKKSFSWLSWVCSGVSGSGKSVSASHIAAQLCRLATHTKKEARVASQLQQAQQILDAFGCSHTKGNRNASMFSKFLEIQVLSSIVPNIAVPLSFLSFAVSLPRLTPSLLSLVLLSMQTRALSLMREEGFWEERRCATSSMCHG